MNKNGMPVVINQQCSKSESGKIHGKHFGGVHLLQAVLHIKFGMHFSSFGGQTAVPYTCRAVGGSALHGGSRRHT